MRDIKKISKHVTLLLFVFALLITLFSPLSATVFAEENDEEETQKLEPMINEEKLEELEDPSYGEKFLSGILVGIGNSLIKVFNAQDISLLVFQRPEITEDDWMSSSFLADRSELILGIFPESLFDGMAVFYDYFEEMTPIPVLVMLVVAGLIIMGSQFGAESKASAKNYLVGILLMIVVLRFGIIFWKILLGINYFIIDMVYVKMKSNGIPMGRFLDTLWGGKEGYDKVSGNLDIGLAIIICIAIFTTFLFNFQYSMRLITLAGAFILLPFVAVGAIYPSKRQNLNELLQLIGSQVFIQAAHAITLGLFFFARASLGSGMSFWLLLAFFMGMPTVANMVQKFIASLTQVEISSSAGGGGAGGRMGQAAMSATGVGGIMALSSVARNMKSGNKPKDGISPKMDGPGTSTGTMGGGSASTGASASGAEGFSFASGSQGGGTGSGGSSVPTTSGSASYDQASGNQLPPIGISGPNDSGDTKRLQGNSPMNIDDQNTEVGELSQSDSGGSGSAIPNGGTSSQSGVNGTAKTGSSIKGKVGTALGATTKGVGAVIRHMPKEGIRKGMVMSGAVAGGVIGTMSTGRADVGMSLGANAAGGVYGGVSKLGKGVQKGGQLASDYRNNRYEKKNGIAQNRESLQSGIQSIEQEQMDIQNKMDDAKNQYDYANAKYGKGSEYHQERENNHNVAKANYKYNPKKENKKMMLQAELEKNTPHPELEEAQRNQQNLKAQKAQNEMKKAQMEKQLQELNQQSEQRKQMSAFQSSVRSSGQL